MKKSEYRTSWIRRIVAKKLFGLYDYTLQFPEDASSDGNIIILYGENGSGKTTILRLAFNLLSPDNSKGHKSYVATIPFSEFHIELVDGTRVVASREEDGDLIGTYEMSIYSQQDEIANIKLRATSDMKIHPTSEEDVEELRDFLKVLGTLRLRLYMLSDDRQIHLAGHTRKSSRLYSTIVEEYETIDEYRNTFLRSKKIDPEKISQQLLAQSIRRAEFWIRNQAMRGSSKGESSVNSIYSDILQRLINQPQSESLDTESTKESIMRRVSDLEEQSKEVAKYGLMPKFKGNTISEAVQYTRDDQLGIIANVLNPYLESIETKLDALKGIYSKIDTLINVLNRFVVSKRITFRLHSGINIIDDNNTILDSEMLSSGERHLLLIFCNSLVAVEQPSIMMIDEPEISLNVKWQRKLIESLLECIGDSPVQYLFATHSIELLSKHTNRVVELKMSGCD